jgi:hypothetical protein
VGAPWPSNGKLPDGVVDALAECGKKGPKPVESVSYDLTFTVHVTEDDREAHVDDVMLLRSTLHLPEVEVCMADALHGMRTPLSALALRRRKLSPDPTVAPESRALLGQPQAAMVLEAAAFFAVGYALYVVVAQVLLDQHHPKPRRPPPATAETEEPPVAAPALPATTAEPAVTAAPAASAVPSTTAPTMPATLTLADQELWRKCNQQHDTYKATQDEAADYARRMASIANLLQNNKASPQERVDLCSLLDKRIKVKQREHKERSKYIELDCDKFDWFNRGTTKAQRLGEHQNELNKVATELKNLYDLKTRFCK